MLKKLKIKKYISLLLVAALVFTMAPTSMAATSSVDFAMIAGISSEIEGVTPMEITTFDITGKKVITFDIAKGPIQFTDDTYSGTDKDGNALTGAHNPDYVYEIIQSNPETPTSNTVSVGTYTMVTGTSSTTSGTSATTYTVDQESAVTKNFTIILEDVNIQNGSEGVCAFNVTNNIGSIVAIILKGENYLYSGENRAGLEKSGGSDAQGMLVLACETGYNAWLADPSGESGHSTGCTKECGCLEARSGNAWYDLKPGDGYHAGAGIGTSGYGIGGSTKANTIAGDNALVNLTIAGGNLTAVGGRGGGTDPSNSSGGGANIGVGSSKNSSGRAGTVNNFRITGGTIYLHRGDHAAACIGGGYRAGYVNLSIYGGVIRISDTVNSAYTQLTGITKVRAAGIGGGGGGKSTSSPAGATVNIYGGDIVSSSQYGAAIGAGAGGASGDGQTGIVNIYGGTIVATTTKGDGKGAGAAIGAGGSLGTGRGGNATVNIYGGTITANSEGGADVGGGGTYSSATGDNGGKGTVTISGGDIKSTNGGIGGGRAYKGAGGSADVTISGGNIQATSIGGGVSKTNAGGDATVVVSGTAEISLTGGIGGGDSTSGDSGSANVTVNGGRLICGGSIGGGNTTSGDGGEAVVTVSGGVLQSNDIGGGISSSGNGGPAIINISGGNILTGSIGGGYGANGNIGYATANISGGDICGQFLMAASEIASCFFTMTDGVLHGVDTTDSSKFNYVQPNGGAVYMDDPKGVVTISGGTIEDCSAANGGAIYMTAGTFTMDGDQTHIQNCSAAENGGAVYLGGGDMTIKGGTINGNKATENGGAIYLGGGTLTVGEDTISVNDTDIAQITGNTAGNSGGGAYIDGGDVVVNTGNIAGNTATGNGGGVAVNNGNYTMNGGNVDNNTSATGSGGGIYVASASNTDSGSTDVSDIKVNILSGSVSNNKAKSDGGGLSVVGNVNGTENINVVIGVNKNHFASDGTYIGCAHGSAGSTACPVMTGNQAEESGGAVYVTGNTKTTLDIYCLTESDSKAGADAGQSNFMKMEGGKVTVTTLNAENAEDDSPVYGCTSISNTMYVTGGQMDLYGAMTNPRIEEIITVDITKADDYFNDHREAEVEDDTGSDQGTKEDVFYKLLYFENFKDPLSGTVTGQYKEAEIAYGEQVAISGSIYSHDGYTIVGWNTSQDMSHDYEINTNTEHPDYGWYHVGNTYIFDGDPVGDLKLYAIWEANGYKVIYDPNIPMGESYTGQMPDQIYYYDTEVQLDANQYGRAGYDFEGWSLTPTGEVQYADQAKVKNLTTEKGEVVTLYAQWAVCDHNKTDHIYTYTLEDDNTTLKRTCSCQNYSETVKLSASDTVYDKLAHPATVTYSSENWIPQVVYKTGETTLDAVPINAGTYTASVSAITADGEVITASVTYVIEKAEQPAPVDKPVYVATINETNKTSTLNIQAISASPLSNEEDTSYDTTYDAKAQYCVVYYEDGAEKSTGWVDGNTSGEYAATFNLTIALTNYYVFARYGEATNYKPSEEIMADASYFFDGDVQLFVTCGTGLRYEVNAATGETDTLNGIIVDVWTLDEYYFPSSYEMNLTPLTSASMTVGNVAETYAGVVREYIKQCEITEIQAGSRLYLTIPDARKRPTIDAKVTENQVFGKITTQTADISRDSSYTVYFDVDNYHVGDYGALSFEFTTTPTGTTVIPAGTTMILLDKNTNTYYWQEVKEATSSVSLESFVQMGTEGINFGFASDTNEILDLDLQLMVDFSKAKVNIAGTDLTTSLVTSKISESRVPAIQKPGVAVTTLKDVSQFTLSATSGENGRVTFTYDASVGVASIWEKRHTALVLTPTSEVPKDAYISFSDGISTTHAYANRQGNFIVPLSNLQSGAVTITLISDLFPIQPTSYPFTVNWMIACSEAELSPMNGVGKQMVLMELTGSKRVLPSMKIAADERLYDKSTDTSMTATFTYQDMPTNYDVGVTLMVKTTSGEYVSTAWSQEIKRTENQGTATVTVPFAGQNAGSYYLHVAADEGLVRISETGFYFIIQ